jgi:hypothetical protein
MTDRGLNTRLRQRSRRSGLMIGISMALTIAVCIAGFSVIYAALDPLTSDFVTADEPTEAPDTGQNIAGPEPTARPTEASDEQGAEEQPQPTETVADAPTATAGSGDNQIVDADEDTFTPDYQISAEENVRLRSGPGTDSDTVTSLTSEQPLQFLGEEQESENPSRDGLSDGQVWMQFRTEDGEEGWVREIDVEPYQE